MTTNDDLLEQRLRASLTERAGDVEPTTVLYERVQRGITRSGRVRALVLAGGVAAAVAVAGLATTFFQAPQPEILPEPPGEAAPSDEASEAPSDGPSDAPSDGPDGVVAIGPSPTATIDGATIIVLGAPVDTGLASVDGIAAAPDRFTDAGVVAYTGTDVDGGVVVGLLATDGPTPRIVASFPARPEQGGIVFSPGGDALAWIDGTDLNVLPLPEDLADTDLGALRSLPLEGDVPEGLVLQQWFSGADAQVALAREPDGTGIWSIPLDDAPVRGTAPTDPAFLLVDTEDAYDAVLLPDLSLLTVRLDADGGVTLRAAGGDGPVEQPVGTLPLTGFYELRSNGGWEVTVHSPDARTAVLLGLLDGATRSPGALYVAGHTLEGVDAATPLLALTDGTGEQQLLELGG